MGKAKTIDRLELTRKKFGLKPHEHHEEHSNTFGLSTCPNCEQFTLRHEGACDYCPSCGWSSCGVNP